MVRTRPWWRAPACAALGVLGSGLPHLLRLPRLPLVVGAVLVGAGPAAAQGDPPGRVRHAARPSIRAGRAVQKIEVDGRLTEPAWSGAEPAATFTQYDPAEGQPGTERTEVRVLVDDHALYIGAHLYERDPANVRSRLSRRDDPVDGDIFAVSIDSRHDHLSAYYFRVTAGGAIRDGVVRAQSGGQGSLDLSWDAVWDAKVAVDSTGWSVEIAIPLSQLPYQREADPTWGIQFERFRWNQQEQTFFSFTPKSDAQGIQNFGHLVGLGPLPPPKRVELLPYVSSRAELHPPSAVTPLQSRGEIFGAAGVDLKLKPAAGYSVTATVNPDFGQVELDPAVVNLTAVETFFPERRPFFVEGREQFEFGQLRVLSAVSAPSLFFSRRIGKPPTLTLEGADVTAAREPLETTIAAAAKLTGKSRGWSTALLDAVTASETGELIRTGGSTERVPVEPWTNYLVGRVRRESSSGNTGIGAFVSSVNRSLGDSALATLLHRRALVGGIDFNHAWNNRQWALDASFAASEVSGSPDAIALTQRGSQRYYERPDATSFHFDPTRRSLSGYAAQIGLTKQAGVHWTGSVAYQGVSPGFEVNDVGFQTDADRQAFAVAGSYQENRPGRIFRNYNLLAFANDVLNRDGNVVLQNYSLVAFARFRDFSGFNAQVNWYPPVLDDRSTRGGPLLLRPTNESIYLTYFSDSRRRYLANVTVGHTTSTVGGKATTASIDFSIQATGTVSISVGPAWSRIHSVAQYVTQVTDPLATATFGTRYVFATIDQREVSMTTRVNWTFTPRLSFQLYLQPLLSSGGYTDLKEFAAPRDFRFAVYGRDAGTISRANGVVTIDPDGNSATANSFTLLEPNFTLRSLRGNAVLRWEYRPGATVFLVWQQRRADAMTLGDLSLGRDTRALLRAPAENVLAIKATYWLTR